MSLDSILRCLELQTIFIYISDPETKALSVGTCVSGMTIKDATNQARSNTPIDEHLIICLGYVDIMNGHDLDVIKTDFLDMMSAFFHRGIQPAVCSLPPLLLTNENPAVQEKMKEFNKFLLGQKHWRVIDLCKQFVRSDTMIRAYYQP